MGTPLGFDGQCSGFRANCKRGCLRADTLETARLADCFTKVIFFFVRFALNRAQTQMRVLP
jgi:hypothetical protein